MHIDRNSRVVPVLLFSKYKNHSIGSKNHMVSLRLTIRESKNLMLRFFDGMDFICVFIFVNTPIESPTPSLASATIYTIIGDKIS